MRISIKLRKPTHKKLPISENKCENKSMSVLDRDIQHKQKIIDDGVNALHEYNKQRILSKFLNDSDISGNISQRSENISERDFEVALNTISESIKNVLKGSRSKAQVSEGAGDISSRGHLNEALLNEIKVEEVLGTLQSKASQKAALNTAIQYANELKPYLETAMALHIKRSSKDPGFETDAQTPLDITPEMQNAFVSSILESLGSHLLAASISDFTENILRGLAVADMRNDNDKGQGALWAKRTALSEFQTPVYVMTWMRMQVKNQIAHTVARGYTDQSMHDFIIDVVKRSINSANMQLSDSKFDTYLWSPRDYTSYVESYFEYKQILEPPFNNIMNIKTIQQMKDVLRENEEKYQALMKAKAAKLNGNPEEESLGIHDVGGRDFEIFIAHNKAAACELGAGTSWCTAVPDAKYFEAYAKPEDPLFIFVHTVDESIKYQLHAGSNQIMDADDREAMDEAPYLIRTLVKVPGILSKYPILKTLMVQWNIQDVSESKKNSTNNGFRIKLTEKKIPVIKPTLLTEIKVEEVVATLKSKATQKAVHVIANKIADEFIGSFKYVVERIHHVAGHGESDPKTLEDLNMFSPPVRAYVYDMFVKYIPSIIGDEIELLRRVMDIHPDNQGQAALWFKRTALKPDSTFIADYILEGFDGSLIAEEILPHMNLEPEIYPIKKRMVSVAIQRSSHLIREDRWAQRDNPTGADVRYALEKYYQHKPVIQPPFNDIMQIAGYKEMHAVIDAAGPAYQAYLKAKTAKLNGNPEIENLGQVTIEAVHSYDDVVRGAMTFNVSIAHNKAAACELGQDTQWCTAVPDANYFEHYAKQNDPLFIMISDENEKYQLHFGSKQVMDSSDRSIEDPFREDLADALRGIPGLSKRYPIIKGDI